MRLRLLLRLLALLIAACLGWWSPPWPWLIHKEPLAGQRLCVIDDGGWGNTPSLAVGRALVLLDRDQVHYLGDPVYLVLGNHDWTQNAEAWLEVARRQPWSGWPWTFATMATACALAIASTVCWEIPTTR